MDMEKDDNNAGCKSSCVPHVDSQQHVAEIKVMLRSHAGLPVSSREVL